MQTLISWMCSRRVIGSHKVAVLTAAFGNVPYAEFSRLDQQDVTSRLQSVAKYPSVDRKALASSICVSVVGKVVEALKLAGELDADQASNMEMRLDGLDADAVLNLEQDVDSALSKVQAALRDGALVNAPFKGIPWETPRTPDPYTKERVARRARVSGKSGQYWDYYGSF